MARPSQQQSGGTGRDLSGAFYEVDRCGHLLDGPDPVLALDRLYDDVLRHVGGRLQDDSAALFIARQSASCLRAVRG